MAVIYSDQRISGSAVFDAQVYVAPALHALDVAQSQQANHLSAGAIRQTHLLGIASAQQANQVSAIIASQSANTFLGAADSQQAGQVSAVTIGQTHLLGIAPCQQGSIVIPVAVQQLAVGGLQIGRAHV